MKITHLLEDGECVGKEALRHSSLHQSNHRFFVRLNAGRKPERHGCTTLQRIGRVVFERPPAESPDKFREESQIVVRICENPTRWRIRAECEGQRGSGMFQGWDL